VNCLFPDPADEPGKAPETILGLVEKAFPLRKRFLAALPGDIAELSRLFTNDRAARNETYLSQPRFLSAYLRYFLPWNLYRLSRLLPGLPLPLKAGDRVIDLGSGPLALPLALWVSRPEFRMLPLEFLCVDRTPSVLAAGKKLFTLLAGEGAPWTIKTIKASLGKDLRLPKADLVAAVNVFNELFWRIPRADRRALGAFTEKNAHFLTAFAKESAPILVIEPGVPRCGEFIALLRDIFIGGGRPPLSPCLHSGPCPVPGAALPRGGKAKWCHFVCDTGGAPASLLKLSATAGLPKERAILSFILAGPAGEAPVPAAITRIAVPAKYPLPVRIISDAFPLPGEGNAGRYGCSEQGLILVRGKKRAIDALVSGALAETAPANPPRQDPKSGAFIAEAGYSLDYSK
jgi:hypothetical protein